jgi:dTDP-4-dehydrorhamnose 3,5-epimerase
MKILKKILPNVFLFKNQYSFDLRGKFLKIKTLNNFKSNQLCFSYNKLKGTIRGLHYQKRPFGETKIITCISGSAYDVIVNCNKKSKDYLKHKTIILNSHKNNSLYIDKDYAHGFQTLENNTILMYNIMGKYKKTAQSGFLFNDIYLNIKWPLKIKKISTRDRKFKPLKENLRGRQ